MRTWLNRDGLYVSDKPKEYFIGKDAHGDNVFINDICEHTHKTRTFKFKVTENDYHSTPYFISKSILCKNN